MAPDISELMESGEKQTCSRCGIAEEGLVLLQRCSVCLKTFCRECEYRAYGGRMFCSEACGRAYFFHGEYDDDEKSGDHEEE